VAVFRSSPPALRGAALRAIAAALAAGVALAASAGEAPRLALPAAPAADAVAPERLEETGLYADLAARRLASDVLPYAPQYPLWSDGATKRRWIRLPPGAAVDASDPDAWRFPPGTQLWKEFSFGRRVETRYMAVRADGTFLYATYAWSEDGREATRAPEGGLRGVHEIRPGLRHDLPGERDCRACHEGSPSPVLGFAALQLSPDRDPLAPHAEPLPEGAVDLAALVSRGLVRGLPRAVVDRPPRIAAASPRARAAQGYLHGNCAGCHNARGPLADLRLDLQQRVAPGAASPLPTALDRASVFRLPASGASPAAETRIAPGEPERSVLYRRVASRSPLSQMPPLGTGAVDEEARGLLEAWIRHDLTAPPRAARVAAHPSSPTP
jgi:hypothetical protein